MFSRLIGLIESVGAPAQATKERRKVIISIIENGNEEGNDLLAVMATNEQQNYSDVLFTDPDDKTGMNLFHHAVLRGSVSILQALRSSLQGTPPPPGPQVIQETCHKSYLSSESFLFSRDLQGRTPAALACTLKDRAKALSILTLMLSWSKRPDLVLQVPDNKKRLPIHHACTNRLAADHDVDVAIVTFILAHSCKAHSFKTSDQGTGQGMGQGEEWSGDRSMAESRSSSSGWLKEGPRNSSSTSSSTLTKLASRAKNADAAESTPPSSPPPAPPPPPLPSSPPQLDPLCSCSMLTHATDCHGLTPLHLSCFSNNAPLARLLMSRGALLMSRSTHTCLDGDVVCDAQSSPLHLAAMHNSFDAARELLSLWTSLGSIDRMHHWDPLAFSQLASPSAPSNGSDPKRKGRKLRGATIDPRLVKDSRGKLPYDIAIGRRFESLSELMDPSEPLPGLKNDQELPVDTPQAFICPITCDLMLEPVVASDGNSYELAAIERWLEDHTTSPLSNVELSPKNTYPNRALQQLIDEFREKKGLPKPKLRVRMVAPDAKKQKGYQPPIGMFGLPVVGLGTSEINGTNPFEMPYTHSSYR